MESRIGRVVILSMIFGNWKWGVEEMGGWRRGYHGFGWKSGWRIRAVREGSEWIVMVSQNGDKEEGKEGGGRGGGMVKVVTE